MLIPILQTLFERDFKKLALEIEAYQNEDNIWKVEGNIINCAGNLVLHIVGNAQHFIGATLYNTGYVRQRDLEFSQKGISRQELLKKISDTAAMVKSTLDNLKEEDLEKVYPINVFGKETSTGFFLTHLTTHLTWHTGHINYHRRLLDL